MTNSAQVTKQGAAEAKKIPQNPSTEHTLDAQDNSVENIQRYEDAGVEIEAGKPLPELTEEQLKKADEKAQERSQQNMGADGKRGVVGSGNAEPEGSGEEKAENLQKGKGRKG